MQVALTGLTFWTAWRVWTSDEYVPKKTAVQVSASQPEAPFAPQQAAWSERLTVYRAQRARLLEASFPDRDARNAALERLREAYFSPAEKQRVAALDRMDGLE